MTTIKIKKSLKPSIYPVLGRAPYSTSQTFVLNPKHIMKIKVLLYEDNPVLLSSLSTLITQSPQLRLTAAESNCQHILQDIQDYKPDIILMDTEMKMQDSIQGLKALRKNGQPTPVIMLTVSEDSDNLQSAILQGASGYLLKHQITSLLLPTIQDALAAATPLTPMVASKILQNSMRPKDSLTSTQFSRLEISILHSINDHNSYPKIASGFSIPLNALFNHIKDIYTKLGVQSQAEALKKLLPPLPRKSRRLLLLLP